MGKAVRMKVAKHRLDPRVLLRFWLMTRKGCRGLNFLSGEA